MLVNSHSLCKKKARNDVMKLSHLIRRRRKRLIAGGKDYEQTGSSSGFESGLTNSGVADKIKKEKVIYGVDQEGYIKKIATGDVKKKGGLKKTPVDWGYLNIGYYLVTPIVAGVFLGLGLDYWLNTKPFFVVFFLFLGTVGSFYNIFKLLTPPKAGLKAK
ncbi:hypothetical protein A3F58_01885 [Candidatus Roizmanbacteria bacterium RIFCSPHIGHO2_12_FULL_37_9b]|uniref:F0F1 ATP synthase subunit n=1 Tax=Candidatus Roizmanbacteria bacterium RIFCSPHIGHO2_02_FULL_38_11 TaxID=1802039 RepID=A0A1F7GWJ1_9BACT|nr:MAG: hypothetical protein A3C25_06445 [Candidatus Roizmanbacteria bacterium RIFCSPHIGHO2_02_FULL_38_11]OGK34859.1 MAG: hypothetical protein A3F58_01885 [Candidatus Roizmanbacteria bacterium RIFCSPHIGHO2_12_FULL_37_9b]